MVLRIVSILILVIGLLGGPLAVSGEKQSASVGLDTAIAVYREDGPEKALPEFEQLLAMFTSSGDLSHQAATLRYIGESHWRMGNFDDSRTHLNQSLGMYRKLGDRYAEGKTLNVLGLLDWDMGDFDAALDSIGEANAIAMELDDKRLTASTLNNLSLVHDELGDYQKSLAQYQQALAIFREIHDRRGQGDALGNIGGVHLLLGHFDQALDYHQQALEISKQLNSLTAMTIDYGNLALSYLGLGKTDKALEYFDRALELAAQTGMRQEEAYWQRGKANALISKGDYNLGMENHRQALSTYEEIGARVMLLETMHDIGRLYLSLGDTVSAEHYFNTAINKAREIGLERAVTGNLIALGDLHFESGHLEESEALFRQVDQRSADAGEAGFQTISQLRLSLVNRERQQYQQAVLQASKALSMAEKNGAHALESEAWYALGELERLQAHPAMALKAYSNAQSVSTAIEQDLLWQIHYARAQALIDSNDREAAISELQIAVKIIESVRSRLKEDRFRAGYVQDKYQVYIRLVRLQLEMGNTGQAFSTSEKLHARRFLAQLDKGSSIARSENERQKEMELRGRIRQLHGLLRDEQEKLVPNRRQMAMETFSTELMHAEREYQTFLDDLGSTQITIQTRNLPALEEIQNRLKADEALIEYLVTDDSVLMFIVRKNQLTSTRSNLGRVSLQSRINLLRELIQQPENDRWLKPASSLSEFLVKPLLEGGALDGVNHLYLVPHGILNYLPFAILPDGKSDGGLFVDSYTLSYLPAASALVRRGARKSENTGLLAMAPENALLRFAPEEASSIVNLFSPGAQLLAGKHATETMVKKLAMKYRILHFATHGFFNKKNPLLSGLQLEADMTNDGLLEVHEILELTFSAQLVTLSACQTGLGSGFFNEIPAGDDFVGLTRAFLVSGADSVLASLWAVEDRSTGSLMKGFYQHLLGNSETATTTATALALIQRKMRASNQYRHPFYWASFVLVG